MKAVVLAARKKLEAREVEKPLSTDGSLVMRVTACGICGSDLHYWEAGVGMDGRNGLVMGHEFAGIVEDPGDRTDLRPGQRVTAIPLNPCGGCSSCLQGSPQMCLNGMKRLNLGQNSPGAYAEYISVRPDMVRGLPDTISDVEAAMIEPAAVALHAVRTSGMLEGDTVLVVGGGAIGLLCAAWARIHGASRIFLSEVNEARAASARAMGDADEVVDGRDPGMASSVRKSTAGGVGIAIDASAAEMGLNAAISALKVRGTLVLAGISLAPQQLKTLQLTLKELTLRGSFGYRVEDFEHAMDTIASGRLAVGKYISRTVDLAGVQDAFETLYSGSSGDVKVIITP